LLLKWCAEALGERGLRLFLVLLQISPGEVTAAGETHRCSTVANTYQAQAVATGRLKQKLPDTIHANGALKTQGCLFEMFPGSTEQ